MSKKDFGEADQLFSVFTRDFGRIDALAQGVRYLKSKLRYNLNTFYYSRFGLVASRDYWRIIDAEELNSWLAIRQSPAKFAEISCIAGLLNRMLRGQEADFILWEKVKKTFEILEKSPALGIEQKAQTFGLLASIKILSHLGYVAERGKWTALSFKEAQDLDKGIMALTIKEALKESHL